MAKGMRYQRGHRKVVCCFKQETSRGGGGGGEMAIVETRSEPYNET